MLLLQDPSVVITVDNCYGEFTEEQEPCAVGADLCMGSLIKNPGEGPRSAHHRPTLILPASVGRVSAVRCASHPVDCLDSPHRLAVGAAPSLGAGKRA